MAGFDAETIPGRAPKVLNKKLKREKIHDWGKNMLDFRYPILNVPDRAKT